MLILGFLGMYFDDLFIQVPPLPLALALHTVTEIMKEGIDRVRNNVHLFLLVCSMY